MRGSVGWITLGLILLLQPDARCADLASRSAKDPLALCALGDKMFRESRFEDAEAAYELAVEIDKRSSRGHLGLGRIAALRSHSEEAKAHFAKAFQLDPRDPGAILAFADVVGDRKARQTLLHNFLALTANGMPASDVQAKLDVDHQLRGRTLRSLESPRQSYRFLLESFQIRGQEQGVMLRAKLNGGKERKLILDTGATGVVLNASASRDTALEFLGPAVLSGFGSAAPHPAKVALAASFEAGELKIGNVLLAVSGADLAPRADGLIGLDVFKDFLIRVDMPARTMELTPFAPGEAQCEECTPVYRLDHLLLVRGRVNGQAEGYFILDTGAAYTLVSRNITPLGGRITTVAGAQGDQEVVLPSTPISIRLGGAREFLAFDYATLDTSEISSRHGAEIAGAIGYSALRGLSLTVDYRHGLVKFAKSARP